MGIMLKDSDDPNQDRTDELKQDFSDLEGTPAFNENRVALEPTKSISTGINDQRTKVVRIIVAVIILSLFIGGVVYGVNYFLGAGGKDITIYLNMTEDEIADGLNIEFYDNTELPAKIPVYVDKNRVTAKSGGDLDLIFINGEKVGVRTDSRKYKFYNVSINESEQNALDTMTYKYDSSFVVLNDMAKGTSKDYFYYRKKEGDCLVLTVNDNSNRVVCLAYYNNYRLISKDLGPVDEEDD